MHAVLFQQHTRRASAARHAISRRVFLFPGGHRVKYTKEPLTFEQQADRLIRRGMQGDRELIVARLASVNYYRLSGYCYPFRNLDDTFRPGTTFAAVWQRYVFDRRLRLLVMDAIERIEVAVRFQLAYHHAHG